MDAKKSLESKAMLGAIIDMQDDKTVDEVSTIFPKRLQLAADQIGGAHICIQNALDILEKLPLMDQTMMMFMLRMDCLRMANIEKMLRRK